VGRELLPPPETALRRGLTVQARLFQRGTPRAGGPRSPRLESARPPAAPGRLQSHPRWHTSKGPARVPAAEEPGEDPARGTAVSAAGTGDPVSGAA